ncbi:MAG: PASTA domain-containing protein [Mesorhizobium sp.]|nr:MAG: PASTA domain-containing protein [Mesorhizobium sp.]TIT83272.1 MAG: PASTA domain-containing protein [Mesorhizobium sp.]
MGLTQVVVPMIKSYDFGIGVDYSTGSPMNRAVQGEITGVKNAGGSTASWSITRITTTEELESALGISAEASYGVPAFQGASARFDFAKRSKVQSSSLFLMLSAFVKLEYLSIDEPELTDAAKQLISEPKAFNGRYGNMFVRGVDRGGLFFAVMRIDALSKQDAMSIAASLGGSYSAFSAEGKMKLDELHQKYASELHVETYHEGGPVDLDISSPNSTSDLYDMLRKWLTSFRDDPTANSVPYSATLAPMTIAKAPPAPNEADIQHASDVLAICAKTRSRILDSWNLVNFITENAYRCEFTDGLSAADFIKASNGYESDLDVVAGCASQAMRQVTKAVMPADFAKQQGKSFPLGSIPSPIPTMKSGMAMPLAAPNFVGMTVAAATELAERFGVTLGYSDKIMSLSAITLMDGYTLQFPDSKITVTSQSPQAGDKLPSDNTVAVDGEGIN